MRISDWISDVCSSDLLGFFQWNEAIAEMIAGVRRALLRDSLIPLEEAKLRHDPLCRRQFGRGRRAAPRLLALVRRVDRAARRIDSRPAARGCADVRRTVHASTEDGWKKWAQARAARRDTHRAGP